MKIEMGESLMASWLKHTFGCQIVQMNWKPSTEWGDCIQPTEIERLYKILKKAFKVDLEIEFTSKKMKSSQLILQGEVDCIGMCLKMNETLIVDKIVAVDIAFHENGLNYGPIDETCSRIYKKYIRTALTIYQYLGTKNAEIIFATPKVISGHVEKLKKVAIDVENKFKEQGFEYQFRFFCNEDFVFEIYNPIKEVSNKIADTSELFMRSLKLANLMVMDGNKSDTKEIQIKKENIKTELSKATQLPVGVVVRTAFQNLSKENKLSKEDIENLCSLNYSKDILSLNFPALTLLTEDENCGFINGYRRYYAQPLSFLGKDYLLSNHWVEANRVGIDNWLSGKIGV